MIPFVSTIRGFFSSRKKQKIAEPMYVVADIATTALGKGASIAPYVQSCREILEKHHLKLNNHAFGTNAEGRLSDLEDAVRECHQVLHSKGVPRVSTNLTISSRTDKAQSLKTRLAV